MRRQPIIIESAAPPVSTATASVPDLRLAGEPDLERGALRFGNNDASAGRSGGGVRPQCTRRLMQPSPHMPLAVYLPLANNLIHHHA